MCMDHSAEGLAKACSAFFTLAMNGPDGVQRLPEAKIEHFFENIFLGGEIIIQACRFYSGDGSDFLKRGGGIPFFAELSRRRRHK